MRLAGALLSALLLTPVAHAQDAPAPVSVTAAASAPPPSSGAEAGAESTAATVQGGVPPASGVAPSTAVDDGMPEAGDASPDAVDPSREVSPSPAESTEAAVDASSAEAMLGDADAVPEGAAPAQVRDAAGGTEALGPGDGAGPPATESGAPDPEPVMGARASDIPPGPGERVLYDRLLGTDVGGGSTAGEGTGPALGLDVQPPAVPTWLWVVGLLGGVGLLLLRSRTMKVLSGPKPIEVMTRTALGKDGSLAVVEVTEADGEKRRLLVGFGGGAPRLVADLGRPFPDVVPGAVDDRAVAALHGRVAESGPRVVGGGVKTADGSRSNATAAWARAVRDADGGSLPPQAASGRLERRHDLIKEVLAERGDDDPHEVNG